MCVRIDDKRYVRVGRCEVGQEWSEGSVNKDSLHPRVGKNVGDVEGFKAVIDS